MTTESIVFIIALLFNTVGLVGTILPVLPGVVLNLTGLLLYNYYGAGNISIITLTMLGALTLLSLVLGYIMPIEIAKRYKGSSWGGYGGCIGAVVGLFTPMPLGAIGGMLLGMFVGEYLYNNNYRTSLKATWGGFLGIVASGLFNGGLALSMLIVLLYDYFSK